MRRLTVLVVGLLKPAQYLGIDLFSSCQADLEWHGGVDLGGLQASSWLQPSRT